MVNKIKCKKALVREKFPPGLKTIAIDWGGGRAGGNQERAEERQLRQGGSEHKKAGICDATCDPRIRLPNFSPLGLRPQS